MRAIAGLVLLVLTAGVARADEENIRTEAWLRRMEMQRQTNALQRQAEAMEKLARQPPAASAPAPSPAPIAPVALSPAPASLAPTRWLVISSDRSSRLMVDANSIRVLGTSRLIRWALVLDKSRAPSSELIHAAVADCAKGVVEPMWPDNYFASAADGSAPKALLERTCAVKPVLTASSR